MEEGKSEAKNFKIVSVRLDNKPRVYSNYVEVNKSEIDLSLKFCDIKAPNNAESEAIRIKGEIEAPIAVEVVIPLVIAGELLGILTKQLKKEDKNE